jgi:hypothetical protein
LTPAALRLTTSSHVIHESQGVVPPAQFVSVPPRTAKVSSTSKVPLRGPVSMTTFVLPPLTDGVGSYRSASGTITGISPACRRFSWLRMRTIVPRLPE